MSATLGEGGDLERLTGRENIVRLSIPEGWDRQGIGRRFFIFPEMSLDADDTMDLRKTLMQRVPRSVVLVPNDRAKGDTIADVQGNGLKPLEASQIEESKEIFTKATSCVAVFSNRYDGIDFPGDECRLLFLDGLPTNSQERFFVSRMGAYALLQSRIQTRVVQAVGRCTRSLQDFSAVVISGTELTDYFNSPTRTRFLHPELQAELDFGARQSSNTSFDDLVENFDIFLRNNAAWEAVNRQILAKRSIATQSMPSGLPQLQQVAIAEIEYQKRLWQQHYEGALESAGKVLAGLTDETLRGYRALWHYLAGAAADYGEAAGIAGMSARSRSHFAAARDAAAGIRWLSSLARFRPDTSTRAPEDEALALQIERLEAYLLTLGTSHDAKFAKKEKAILDGLASSNASSFETAQRELGNLLGFQSGKHESDASPDPWWLSGGYCIVFEDHSDAKPTSALGAEKARQATGHPNWMRANQALTKVTSETDILSVLVS
ncbi:helicase C-terminal domain-containing protein [Bradyrhizobium sp. CB82]|uniref:helicase C-terminal domain-containing protein n=1 Tax=Bradyrhizobium sp. CB82 TaxID=3039159 RepID=UPI0024B114C7|nr:helicase C-terminal domain-containing protein [Bradyrhizobium sp. CB82]WFU40834.1 helicase C-terminal domain-containing protein [Bradyrhizobium sp. CB82]